MRSNNRIAIPQWRNSFANSVQRRHTLCCQVLVGLYFQIQLFAVATVILVAFLFRAPRIMIGGQRNFIKLAATEMQVNGSPACGETIHQHHQYNEQLFHAMQTSARPAKSNMTFIRFNNCYRQQRFLGNRNRKNFNSQCMVSTFYGFNKGPVQSNIPNGI